MGEHFRAAVVRREEAHDLAMAGAAIEVVIAVENNVLGPLEFSQPDRLCGRQPVVELERRARARYRRLRLAHAQVDRRDIDLVQHLVAVLQPADVDGDRDGKQDAEHHLVGAGAVAEPDQAVGHDEHDHRAHQALDHRAAPAAETVAADDGGGERENLESQPRAGTGAAQSRGDQEARRGRTESGKDVGKEDGLAHPDAGIVRGAAGTADRQHVPAGARAGQRNMHDDRQHECCQDRNGQAEHGAVTDEVPGIGRGHRHLDLRAVGDHQDVVERTADDEGHQRGDEGPEPQEADQVAVDRAADEAGSERGGKGDPDRLLEDEEGRDGGKGGQGEDRTDGEIDAAAQHDDREADDDEAELAELAGRFLQRIKLEEARDQAAEGGDSDDQRDEGDRIVRPALAEDFANDVIGNEIVAPGL